MCVFQVRILLRSQLFASVLLWNRPRGCSGGWAQPQRLKGFWIRVQDAQCPLPVLGSGWRVAAAPDLVCDLSVYQMPALTECPLALWPCPG